MVRLEPMTEAEFRASLDQATARRAAEQVDRGLWTPEAAAEASRVDFAELLPQGFQTPAKRFRKVVDERSGTRVGETWYSVEEKGGRVQFWVDWIAIDAPFRRKGYATGALRLLASEALKLGADRLGLHVFSDNKGALALYSKLGFEPTSLRMAKRLP